MEGGESKALCLFGDSTEMTALVASSSGGVGGVGGVAGARSRSGVKRLNDSYERKMETQLNKARREWKTALDELCQKSAALTQLMVNEVGFECPTLLLGVPAEELDKLDKLIFWAKMVLSKKDHVSLRLLCDDVVALKHKVRNRESVVSTLSYELVQNGASPFYAMKQDNVLMYNTPAFSLQDVLSSEFLYKPTFFDHNDVYYHFSLMEEVIEYHTTLFDKCVRLQCVPLWRNFAKLFQDSGRLTKETLAGGFFVGLLCITNPHDQSHGNDKVCMDQVSVVAAEQLRGVYLQPGKKYVTWYLGKYSQRRSDTTEVVDTLYDLVCQAPAYWNSEFQQAWKATAAGVVPYRSMYCVLLPGVKEVTVDTWSSTDTLDWIVTQTHHWAKQLGTYAPHGYNLPLNHQFHRTLFLNVPHLKAFPVLWYTKQTLEDLVVKCNEQKALLLYENNRIRDCLGIMKREFLSQRGFHIVFYQWAEVKSMLAKHRELLSTFLSDRECLKSKVSSVQKSLLEQYNKVEALLKLTSTFATHVLPAFQTLMENVFHRAQEVVQDSHEQEDALAVTVTVDDMVELDPFVSQLEFLTSSWVEEVCAEVCMPSDHFFESLSLIKGLVKTSRNEHHPDKQHDEGEADVNLFYKFQAWVLQLEAIIKLHDLFFTKVR